MCIYSDIPRPKNSPKNLEATAGAGHSLGGRSRIGVEFGGLDDELNETENMGTSGFSKSIVCPIIVLMRHMV